MPKGKLIRILAIPILPIALFVIIKHGSFSELFAQKPGKVKPKYASPLVTSSTKAHAVDIDVDITGAKQLHLVITDGGNGYSCDWADWAEPRLIGKDGELKLTDLKWKKAQQDWGQARVNRNAGGGPLRIADKPVEYGIGSHANSIISYDLPKGYTRFKAKGGLDNGGTNQGSGQATSVKFLVYLDQVPKQIQRGQQGGREPIDAVANLDVAEGLEATLFAAEPMLLSPTNIDIDSKGRVWVCEVVNYRRRNGQRPEGDRILILEDTDGDGKADKRKVYYQGRDVDSAMGICVLGNQVIVSCSPNVFVFTDTDGDDKPDKKEVLFTKTGQPQHDHSAHAFLFGPDGRMYWNFGNTGKSVHDRAGKVVVDKAGNQVVDNGRPYFGGMVFRCDEQGNKFEVLGHNFRNNYEVTVDSFGTLWQSDNDDDGNKGVRINFVMEFGNYGYLDERNGAGWRVPRTNLEPEIPLRHWHLNDPGVVPNLLQTGAGSPTGICVYEGTLLPKAFHNQVIHCDAGPNIVRAYPATKDGAGYKAKMLDILRGTRDKWFRPSDVCVAPDGSLFVADWYDPGVGGHGMGDVDRGRIFRVAPPKTKYEIPQLDLKSAKGAVEALKNPALSVRYLAWKALRKMDKKAMNELNALYDSDQPAHLRARALWLLGQIDRGKYIQKALEDKNPDIRILGLRLARQLNENVAGAIETLKRDPSPQVRRECAIALRSHTVENAAGLWAELAAQHDGKDRWYLEALGIAARPRWDACIQAWLELVGEKWNTAVGRDILWRSRSTKTPEFLTKIIMDKNTDAKELPRYFRAFDFLKGNEKDEAIVVLAFARLEGSQERQNLIRTESLSRIKGFDVSGNPKYREALNRALDSTKGTSDFVTLVEKFSLKDRYPDVMQLALKHATGQVGVDAISLLLKRGQQKLIQEQLQGKNLEAALETAHALGLSKDAKAVSILLPIVHDQKQGLALRRAAVRAVGQSQQGATELVKLARMKKLDAKLKEAAASVLHQGNWRRLQKQITQFFPLPASKNSTPLPSIAELLKRRGDVKRGELVFQKTGTCINCHQLNKMGKEVGPNLAEIGNKLSRQAMFESILYPNAAISHNYETWLAELSKGTSIQGLKVSETPTEVTLKDKDGIVHRIKRSDIDELLKQPTSMMPADLMKVMSAQDLIDVVSYLTTLKK